MNNSTYRSTIKSKPFFYMETYKIAELYMQDFTNIEIKNQVMNHNILQVKTEARKKEILNTILRRLQALDRFLIGKITTADMNTSKLITIYAILKTDRLFFEFMNEVFREKLIIHDLTLEERDFNAFFESKRQQSDTVAKWKDYTFYKLKQVYIRILSESGLVNNHESKREIKVPTMNPDVLDYIRDTDDEHIINAIVGEGTS